MEYIRYTGKNAFQTFGFVKDNSYKLDQWKMRFGRYPGNRNLKVYSNKMSRMILVGKGEWIFVDPSEEYNYKIKSSNRFPLLLLIKGAIKGWIKRHKVNKYTNTIEDFLDDK